MVSQGPVATVWMSKWQEERNFCLIAYFEKYIHMNSLFFKEVQMLLIYKNKPYEYFKESGKKKFFVNFGSGEWQTFFFFLHKECVLMNYVLLYFNCLYSATFLRADADIPERWGRFDL